MNIIKHECPHCKFVIDMLTKIKNPTNREYWLMTEVFVYLHGGKDYCNWGNSIDIPHKDVL